MELEGKQIRFGIIGSACIGKTCVIKRFVENSFHGSQYNPTPGVDFFSRRMTIKPIGTVSYIIVDIGASALSSKMLPLYLHGIDVFLLTYDMTNASSLNELRKWITIIAAFAVNKHSEPSIALVGSKGDLEHLRAIRLDAHTRFAQEYSIPLSFLVSAKSGESVLTCFTKSAVYHLSPDARHGVREHGILQANIPPPKRSSIASVQNHPMILPSSSQGIGGPKPMGLAKGGAGADQPSTACSVQ